MYEVLLVAYLLVALALVGLVLIQHGKGADMGASFGAGASNTIFGSSGSGNFLTRSTAIFATLFFVICLVLGNMSTTKVNEADDFENLAVEETTEVSVAADDAQSAETLSADLPQVEEEKKADSELPVDADAEKGAAEK